MVEDALGRELPSDLDRTRLLEIAEPAAAHGGAGSFDFLLCRNALRSTPAPMALLAELRRLAAPGGVLLLEAEVDPDSTHSGYARFVPTAESSGWVPGRLALRWMIEVSGFDVERWLGEDDRAWARLRAVRAEREPARSAP